MSPYKVKTVRLVISQPRISHSPKEWALPIIDLLEFGTQARVAGVSALLLQETGDQKAIEACLNPSEDACRFCLAKATCPALAAEVAATVAFGDTSDVEFADLDVAEPTSEVKSDALGIAMSKVGLIEVWCKGVRAEVERRLLSGEPVAGYKLVQGRKGARHWVDANEVEAQLRKWRVKTEEMYKLSLISPTEAERRMAKWLDDSGMEHDPIVGPRNWAKLLKKIGQSDGKPSVAPESDKRPALVVGASDDDFTDETGGDLL